MLDNFRQRTASSSTATAPVARGDGRIEARELYKWFPGGIVLEDVSLTVGSGEFVCIVGPSGCGKTTLLRLMAGLAEIDHGSVSVGGIPVTGSSPSVAVVFQHFG
ncbi:MAG: ATP-binding cassette domain-containing protein, partial [Streptosporangiaceae bacterium]|nr:ATP-binding cassette domain-containing protein [Streptosporangiaceae bacterium]